MYDHVYSMLFVQRNSIPRADLVVKGCHRFWNLLILVGWVGRGRFVQTGV